MLNNILRIATLTLIVTIFSACSRNIPTAKERLKIAKDIVEDKQMVESIYYASDFNFFTLSKINPNCKTLKVYIEGDGLSWVTRSRISPDPTPLNPLALKLMNLDHSGCKIYIARPCQYINSNNCDKKYWTSHRFSNKIVNNFDEVLTQIKKRYSLDNFELVGYSGGAAIASLLTNTRDDVTSLTTIAGNLNTKLWTDIKNLTPLSGSLNPIDYTNNMQSVKQYHLIGNDDNVIPKEILFSYIKKFNNQSKIFHRTYNATHNKNWENGYKQFLEDIKE